MERRLSCPPARTLSDSQVSHFPRPSTPPQARTFRATSRPHSAPWKPGCLRSAYGAICCHLFKPKNMTDDIFLAQILGHKLLGPNADLSVGQSWEDFFAGED